MIETPRLILKPLSLDELIKHIKSPDELTKDLGLKPSRSLRDKETQEAILDDLLPNLSKPGKDYLFNTMWIIIEKNKKTIVGGICFHGEPDSNGEVEIGYGTDDDFRNFGYMSETISALIQWAKINKKIKTIKAETDKSNISSIRVLEKNNFVKIKENDSTIIMKFKIMN
ncbi:MAG: GNAT family N-acetyltransferase [Bacteroidales bacterium]|nr:GNAT family N-acetyltransferase [Bacteroidales bacterium]